MHKKVRPAAVITATAVSLVATAKDIDVPARGELAAKRVLGLPKSY